MEFLPSMKKQANKIDNNFEEEMKLRFYKQINQG